MTIQQQQQSIIMSPTTTTTFTGSGADGGILMENQSHPYPVSIIKHNETILVMARSYRGDNDDDQQTGNPFVMGLQEDKDDDDDDEYGSTNQLDNRSHSAHIMESLEMITQ